MSHPRPTRQEADRQLEVYEEFARDVIRRHPAESAARRIARILVPTDFSVSSMWALRYGEELARRFGADIILVHVQSPVPPPEAGPARKELEALAALLGERGVRAHFALRVGGLAEEILAVGGKEHADLIVMGTHGRTGIAHVLMGSVAETVVRRSACPVLTVRKPAGGTR